MNDHHSSTSHNLRIEVDHRNTRAYSYLMFFFFNDTATTEIYTLSLHDALPISRASKVTVAPSEANSIAVALPMPCVLPQTRAFLSFRFKCPGLRSEEHTSELQSQSNLVCRLLLEKKKKTANHERPPQQHEP